jgi:quercetin 2,3-dioxygenase
LSDIVLSTDALGMPWATEDPFLFCVHHLDSYPKGDGKLGPAAGLAGRNLGQDFDNIDGWNMYHGRRVPGFPAHPHRGFETLTVVLQGRLDHADSLGAAARYGDGDAQWMTAGAGIVHSEMFPLLRTDGPNTAELFQIWVNLPPERKLAQPGYRMLWRNAIPKLDLAPGARVTLVTGRLGGREAAPPPPQSWAADPANELGVWIVDLRPGAGLELPPASKGLNRTLYAFEGEGLRVDGQPLAQRHRARLRPDAALKLQAGAQGNRLLLLQGRPIGAPVANYGPFVMNNRRELEEAFEAYQKTRFGAWAWASEAPTHGQDPARFARYPDGTVENPG